MLRTLYPTRVALVLAALVFSAGCGDNLSPADGDGGVDAAATGRTATTVGNVVHASSPHYRLYATLGSGEAASSSAHFDRRGPITGGGQ